MWRRQYRTYFFCGWKISIQTSFNIGTIRLLKDMVDDVKWNEVKDSSNQKQKDLKRLLPSYRREHQQSFFAQQKEDGKP